MTACGTARERLASVRGVAIGLAAVLLGAVACSAGGEAMIEDPGVQIEDGRYSRFIDTEGIEEISRTRFDLEVSDADQAGASAFAAKVRSWADETTLVTASDATAAGLQPINDGNSHWVNMDNVKDGAVLDPYRPEFLVVAPESSAPGTSRSGAQASGAPVSADRSISVVGVMFTAGPIGETGPQPFGNAFVWHRHTYSTPRCFELEEVMRLEADLATCPSIGRVSRMTPEMLHVWLVENPGGVFASEMATSTADDSHGH